jgi:hypothetical protein
MNRGEYAVPGASKTVHVEADSELGQLLEAAAEADILLEKEGVRFRLNRVDVVDPVGPTGGRGLAPERVLRIIGLGASVEGSDVARLKDHYVAEAAADRGR